ncbi:substrate-binding domain-containing protein [Corynebacterium sp. 3HC-13]|uniref:LacI family DNA-binding transcriptional regulator n=1 Tax=Corynebacterium poyangense TaxID=2684405 RepID=UPI001CCB0D2D|nr:LacI family DNA-binding transcriptional regulator [Corynebacterium poyangense]MBZ8178311.1 substrate-binding domain-containing protein [Corynebacterium poyangense]
MNSGHRTPTMNEVARKAAVSVQTVSRVVNGFPGVKESTRKRVNAAIQELGYRPNLTARALVTRRSGLIGVVSVGSFLHGPTNTLAAIEKAARKNGRLTLLATIENSDEIEFLKTIEEFQERNVEGLVIIASREAVVRYCTHLKLTTPLIIVGPRPADLGSLPCLSVDQFAGAKLAIDHLLDLGHRDIALVTGPRQWVDAQQRLEGALSACESQGVHPRIFSGDWSPQSGFLAGEWLNSLPEPSRPTAVFAANDSMAMGIMRALSSSTTHMAVVGFDNIPESEFLTIPLTTIHQDFTTLGRRVLEALLALIAGEEADFSPIAPHLIIRESSL